MKQRITFINEEFSFKNYDYALLIWLLRLNNVSIKEVVVGNHYKDLSEDSIQWARGIPGYRVTDKISPKAWYIVAEANGEDYQIWGKTNEVLSSR